MKLNRRERTFVGVGLIVLAVLALYFLVIEPVAAGRDRLARLNARMELELAEIKILAAQYRALAGRQALLQQQDQNRKGDFAPFSYLENLAREAGLTGRIESMTPVASSGEEGRKARTEFDVRMSGIRLLDLVRFLYRLETSDKLIFVVNLNIRPRYLNPDLLDVSLRLAAPAAT